MADDKCGDEFGSCLQDCSLITQTFERAANSDFTEPAAFAVLYRGLENMRTGSMAMSTGLSSYLLQPSTATQIGGIAGDSISGAVSSTSGSSGLQNAVLSDMNISVPSGEEFGKKLLDWAKNCIPCIDRILSMAELNPSLDLLEGLAADVKAQLDSLKDLTGLLGNFDIYSDYCNLISFLGTMCVPDLQKMISILMLMFMDNLLPQLDLSLDMILKLVAPLFTPIFAAITMLLDQFTALVFGPIDCALTAIQLQLEKTKGFQQDVAGMANAKMSNVASAVNKTTSGLGLGTAQQEKAASAMSQAAGQVADATNQASQSISSSMSGFGDGLTTLRDSIIEARASVQSKLAFYIEEITSLLGTGNASFKSQIAGALKKTQLVRLVSFIMAIIKAITSKSLGCNGKGSSATQSELDAFVSNFLNPTGSFQLSLDPQGNLVIDEKIAAMPSILSTWPNESKTLPKINNMMQFDGSGTIDTSGLSSTMTQWAQQASQIQNALTTEVRVIYPCHLQTTQEDASKVNQWIADLNKAGVV